MCVVIGQQDAKREPDVGSATNSQTKRLDENFFEKLASLADFTPALSKRECRFCSLIAVILGVAANARKLPPVLTNGSANFPTLVIRPH